jgi:hypothetical protein
MVHLFNRNYKRPHTQMKQWSDRWHTACELPDGAELLGPLKDCIGMVLMYPTPYYDSKDNLINYTFDPVYILGATPNSISHGKSDVASMVYLSPLPGDDDQPYNGSLLFADWKHGVIRLSSDSLEVNHMQKLLSVKHVGCGVFYISDPQLVPSKLQADWTGAEELCEEHDRLTAQRKAAAKEAHNKAKAAAQGDEGEQHKEWEAKHAAYLKNQEPESLVLSSNTKRGRNRPVVNYVQEPDADASGSDK